MSSCPICISPCLDTVTTPCDHTYCRTCITRWLKDHFTCCECRAPLNKTFLRKRNRANDNGGSSSRDEKYARRLNRQEIAKEAKLRRQEDDDAALARRLASGYEHEHEHEHDHEYEDTDEDEDEDDDEDEDEDTDKDEDEDDDEDEDEDTDEDYEDITQIMIDGVMRNVIVLY